MSRTKRAGTKEGCGYDYWSHRPYSSSGFGSKIKKLCRRQERRQAKVSVRLNPEEQAKRANGMCGPQ